MLDLIHYSKKARDTLDRVKEFLKEHVYPVEMVRKHIYLISNVSLIIINNYIIAAKVLSTMTYTVIILYWCTMASISCTDDDCRRYIVM